VKPATGKSSGSATGNFWFCNRKAQLPVASSVINQSVITSKRKDPVEIYQAYPKHVAKEAALKAIQERSKSIGFDDLLQAVKDCLLSAGSWIRQGSFAPPRYMVQWRVLAG